MSAPVEILTRMISIMHTSGSFAGLTGYTIGLFPYIPIADRYSICQLVIADSLDQSRELTNVDRFYTGQAIFEVMSQDTFELTGTPKIATASSFVAAVDHCTAFMKLFGLETNKSLGNLTFSGGGHVEFIRLDQNVEYIPTVNRENNYLNQGTCTFQVQTIEPAT